MRLKNSALYSMGYRRIMHMHSRTRLTFTGMANLLVATKVIGLSCRQLHTTVPITYTAGDHLTITSSVIVATSILTECYWKKVLGNFFCYRLTPIHYIFTVPITNGLDRHSKNPSSQDRASSAVQIYNFVYSVCHYGLDVCVWFSKLSVVLYIFMSVVSSTFSLIVFLQFLPC